MPTARSVKLDSARSLVAADPTGILGGSVQPKEIARIYAELAYVFRDRLYTPMVTVCMMILQALDEDSSQRKVVAVTMAAWRAGSRLMDCPSPKIGVFSSVPSSRGLGTRHTLARNCRFASRTRTRAYVPKRFGRGRFCTSTCVSGLSSKVTLIG